MTNRIRVTRPTTLKHVVYRQTYNETTDTWIVPKKAIPLPLPKAGTKRMYRWLKIRNAEFFKLTKYKNAIFGIKWYFDNILDGSGRRIWDTSIAMTIRKVTKGRKQVTYKIYYLTCKPTLRVGA